MASPADEQRAAFRAELAADIFGYVAVAASNTVYTIALDIGIYQVLTDLTAGIAIVRWDGTNPALPSSLATGVGVVANGSVAPNIHVVADATNVKVKAPTGTGAVYFQRISP